MFPFLVMLAPVTDCLAARVHELGLGIKLHGYHISIFCARGSRCYMCCDTDCSDNYSKKSMASKSAQMYSQLSAKIPHPFQFISKTLLTISEQADNF